MPQVVIATTNPGKVRELAAILADVGLDAIGLADVATDVPEPVEDADTFAGNAIRKATHYARALRRPCIADDSGLEVDALDGAPGVRSARFAAERFPPGADRPTRDAANNALLLERLAGTPAERRTARFVCVIALADPHGAVQHHARGIFAGRIGSPPDVPRGTGGFGYDPLFLVAPDFARTSAELSPAEKNRVSHRGAAARTLTEQLRAER